MKKTLFLQKKLRQPTNPIISNFVPIRLSPFLYDLNSLYSTTDFNIIQGRDKEISRIYTCLMKSNYANAMLLGDHGVGKSATLQKLVTNVIQGNCPDELKNYHFIYFDLMFFLARLTSTERKDTKMARELLPEIIDFFLKYNNLVLVIDQIHLIQADYLLSYEFSLLAIQPHSKIIGLSTEEEFYNYFELDKKIRARLEIINIFEPKPKQIYSMICNVVERLQRTHNISISKELVEYIISVSSAFSLEICNPQLTLTILEKSMIVAKRNNKNEVSKEDINVNFNFDYEMYNKMSYEDKRLIAYHEAGHFVVDKLSTNIRNCKTTAITIIPSEDFLGVTLFLFEPEKQANLDIDYYVDNIAVDLAGRIAETMIPDNNSNKYTSGAMSDLKNATETARSIITEFGMIESLGKNMTFFSNYDFSDLALISEDMKNKINQETEKLIEKAYNRAKEILKENHKLLTKIAEELLENEVLDEKDLDRICSKEYK